MDLEDTIKDCLEQILIKLGIEFSDITISEDEKDNYSVNIISDEPSLLIGYHGENIYALQQIVKILAWKKAPNEQFNVMVDVDDYRKRQEENILSMAERKVEKVRKTRRPEMMPPMSPYFRRKVHMLCMSAGYDDVETFSEGDGDRRYVVIKLKA